MAYCRLPFNLTTAGESKPVVGELVSGRYFELLGARPELGRTLLEEDDVEGAALSAVISYRLWKRLGGDSKLVGQSLQINGQSARVVGAAEEGFGELLLDWYGRADVWLPLTAHESFLGRDLSSFYSQWLMVAGRLGDGVSIDQARADVDRIAREIERLDPVANKDRAILVATAMVACYLPARRAATVDPIRTLRHD